MINDVKSTDSCVDQSAQVQSANRQHYLAEREQLFLKSRTISVSEMATTLAHELNQPLGAIKNILNGVQMRLKNDGKVSTEILDAIVVASNQTSYASRIIERIRDFTDSRKPNYTDIDVVELIEESVKLMDWVFEAEEVVVVVHACPGKSLVSGDKTMLQQVITNVFRNAIEAMRNNGEREKRIEIQIEKEFVIGEVKISVSDTGHGIEKASEKNLFTPFYSEKIDGMGVGLCICRSFVELHQGTMWLSSGKTVGCTAHMVLRAISGEKIDG